MNQKTYYLIYLSTAVRPFSRNELLELLAQSRRKNDELGITGMLLYKKGSFQQVLEGPKEAVQSLFAKIKADPRHYGVIQVMEGLEDKRDFPDWSMGFTDLDSADAAKIPGYTPFLDKPLTDETFISDPSVCRLMMRLFKQNAGA